MKKIEETLTAVHLTIIDKHLNAQNKKYVGAIINNTQITWCIRGILTI